MANNARDNPRSATTTQNEDQFSPGVAFCAGCTLELNLRLISRVLGKDIIFVGTPSCSAPVLHGQNTAAWHRHAYYACIMTGVASSATGLTRYYQKAGIDATVVCHTGDGCAQDVGFQTLSGAAERNEKMIYICYDNEGYMNTGIQQSSATPFGASTSTTPTGKSQQRQDHRLQEHAAGHGHARHPLRGHGHPQPPGGLRQEAGQGQGEGQGGLRLPPRLLPVRGGLEDPGGLLHPGVPRRGAGPTTSRSGRWRTASTASPRR